MTLHSQTTDTVTLTLTRAEFVWLADILEDQFDSIDPVAVKLWWGLEDVKTKVNNPAPL